jgi:hypothetical protein
MRTMTASEASRAFVALLEVGSPDEEFEADVTAARDSVTLEDPAWPAG